MKTPDHALPVDPDQEDVPQALADHEGDMVTVTNPDGTTETGVLVISPDVFGQARRLREGFYGGDDHA